MENFGFDWVREGKGAKLLQIDRVELVLVCLNIEVVIKQRRQR
jgi:hypothetical protein